MPRQTLIPGMRAFLYLWLGQLVSGIGSGLTAFALGIWVYQRTGSAAQFALISVFATLPAAVTLPLAGALVDRWDRRAVMLIGNAGAGLTTLATCALILSGGLEVWHIYLLVAIRSSFGSLLFPAYSTATTLLVPKQHFGRASGMFQATQASAQIFSPLLASQLLAPLQLQGIVFIDFCTYLFALATLLFVRIPRPEATGAGGATARAPVSGWAYVRERRGLLALLVYFAAVNFVLGCATILFTPMVLSFASPEVLGVVLSVSGVGYLCGTLVMSVWGGPQRRLAGVLGFGFVFGLCSVVVGLRPYAPLIAAGAFCMYFVLPLINGCSQAIWQSKVPIEVQGRVFAVRRLVGASTVPTAYLLAGPLADRVFEPLVADGRLGAGVRQLVGEGPGRGIGLMFVVAGALTMLAQLGGYLYVPLRRVEKELPDAIPDVALSVT